MHLSRFSKILSQILILAMLHLCWLTSFGYAEMVPTESAVQSQTNSPTQTDRQHLLDLLDRQEVIDELEKYGISKVEAVARINSLTDEEVILIAGKLDELPAGGEPFAIAAAAAVTLAFLIVAYVLEFVFKGFYCIFADCKESIFKPFWWPDKEDKVKGDSSREQHLHNEFDNEKAAAERLDNQVCRFDCNEAEKACFNFFKENNSKEKQRCEDDKDACYVKCSNLYYMCPGCGPYIPDPDCDPSMESCI